MRQPVIPSGARNLLSSPAWLAAMAGVLLGAAPAAAQAPPGASAFTQGFQHNPFGTLMHGRWSFGGSLGTEVANNMLDVGDAVSIFVIACNPPGGKVLGGSDCDDSQMRPSDLILIAGVLPKNADTRLRMTGGAEFRLTMPTRFGTFGLMSAGRTIGRMTVPKELTGLIRDGFTGDAVTVKLGDLEGSALAYMDAGVLWMGRTALTPRVRFGLGAHRLTPIANPGVSFRALDAARTPSRITISVEDSVSADITMVSPTGGTVAKGGGWAFDVAAVTDLGPKFQLSAMITGMGSMTVTHRGHEVRTLHGTGMDFETFQERLDSMPVDTVAGRTETVTMPASIRLEASYRPWRRLGLGFAFDKAMDPEWALDDTRATAVVEYALLRWLPLRAGMHTGSSFGASVFGGLGLRTGRFVSELEVVSRGFPFDRTRGVALRTGGGIRF